MEVLTQTWCMCASGHAGMGCREGEPVRARPRHDAVQHLPGPVERHEAQL